MAVKRSLGFSLIELVFVIGLIVLISVTFSTYFSSSSYRLKNAERQCVSFLEFAQSYALSAQCNIRVLVDVLAGGSSRLDILKEDVLAPHKWELIQSIKLSEGIYFYEELSRGSEPSGAGGIYYEIDAYGFFHSAHPRFIIGMPDIKDSEKGEILLSWSRCPLSTLVLLKFAGIQSLDDLETLDDEES